MPTCILFTEFQVSSSRDGITEKQQKQTKLKHQLLRQIFKESYVFVCVFSCTSGTQTGGTTSRDLLCALLLVVTGDRIDVFPVVTVERLT